MARILEEEQNLWCISWHQNQNWFKLTSNANFGPVLLEEIRSKFESILILISASIFFNEQYVLCGGGGVELRKWNVLSRPPFVWKNAENENNVLVMIHNQSVRVRYRFHRFVTHLTRSCNSINSYPWQKVFVRQWTCYI